MDCDTFSFTISKNGTVSISGGSRGIQINQVETAQAGNVSAKNLSSVGFLGSRMRSKPSNLLDGEVPEEFKRPTQGAAIIKRDDLLTQASFSGAIDLISGETNTRLNVIATAYSKIDMIEQ